MIALVLSVCVAARANSDDHIVAADILAKAHDDSAVLILCVLQPEKEACLVQREVWEDLISDAPNNHREKGASDVATIMAGEWNVWRPSSVVFVLRHNHSACLDIDPSVFAAKFTKLMRRVSVTQDHFQVCVGIERRRLANILYSQTDPDIGCVPTKFEVTINRKVYGDPGPLIGDQAFSVNLIGLGRRPSREARENQGSNQTAQAEKPDPDLPACNGDGIFGGFCHAPLFAKISLVAVFGAKAVGLVIVGLLLLLFGNNYWHDHDGRLRRWLQNRWASWALLALGLWCFGFELSLTLTFSRCHPLEACGM